MLHWIITFFCVNLEIISFALEGMLTFMCNVCAWWCHRIIDSSHIRSPAFFNVCGYIRESLLNTSQKPLQWCSKISPWIKKGARAMQWRDLILLPGFTLQRKAWPWWWLSFCPVSLGVVWPARRSRTSSLFSWLCSPPSGAWWWEQAWPSSTATLASQSSLGRSRNTLRGNSLQFAQASAFECLGKLKFEGFPNLDAFK